MADEGQHEGTHLDLHRYFVANSGGSGSREIGLQYLAKLESTRIKAIILNDNTFSMSTDMWIKRKAIFGM